MYGYSVACRSVRNVDLPYPCSTIASGFVVGFVGRYALWLVCVCVCATGWSHALPAATRKPRARPKGGKDDSSKVTELNEKLAKLRATIEGLEKERNFYFG